MEGIKENPDAGTIKKYLAIVSIIDGVQNRLKWSELFYIFLNLIVFFSLINFLTSTMPRLGRSEIHIYLLFMFFCHVIGLSINTYWAAASARLHLQLKLRYFQARFLERKMNCSGEFIFSDEEPFFNPEVRRLESPDGKETVFYPAGGILSMDGFVGTAQPRFFSIALPSLFFILYLASLIFFTIALFAE